MWLVVMETEVVVVMRDGGGGKGVSVSGGGD